MRRPPNQPDPKLYNGTPPNVKARKDVLKKIVLVVRPYEKTCVHFLVKN